LSGEIEFRREALPPSSLLEREWRTLEAAARPSFFTSWHWIGTLLAAIPAASRPMLLRGSMHGETLALALLGSATTFRRHGLIRSRGFYLNETGDRRFDAMTIEHNGILTAAECEPAVLGALLGWFAQRRGEADELHVSGSLLRLPQRALAEHRLTRNEIAVSSHSVDLCRLAPSDGELYPVLSANARQQLRRAFRRFRSDGPLRLNEAATAAQAQSYFTALKALHCASWERRGKTHAFSGAFFEHFHRLLIERSFAEGGTQLLEASAGERVIGYLYNFRRGSRVYAYQSGFADADRQQRPGAVTHALAIRHAFRSGLQVYDFMAGDNRLKQSFATRGEPMLWQVVQQPRLVFGLERLGRRVKHAVQRAFEKKSLAAGKANR
jgi:CelD/BcsL family acetyltransferase involved in cellulose biosynthesis